MRFFFFILILLATFFISNAEAKKKPYYASVCAIFQDEAPYLKEWIEYHQMLGFEHFYLYNNRSSDHYKEVLQPYIKTGIVEIIEWPQIYETNFDPVQKGAYNHCILQSKSKTTWLAVIDIDEFIVPVHASTIREVLSPYDKKDKFGGLLMFWVFYGTSYLPKIPDGKLLIESLTRRTHLGHPWNANCKTICKPSKVKYFHVHGADYVTGSYDYASNGRHGMQAPVLDQIRVNHYWTRAEDFMLNVKAPRRAKFTGHEWSQFEIDQIMEHTNEVEDNIILKFIPKLRKKMGLPSQ